jgi:hypothetical protein
MSQAAGAPNNPTLEPAYNNRPSAAAKPAIIHLRTRLSNSDQWLQP